MSEQKTAAVPEYRGVWVEMNDPIEDRYRWGWGVLIEGAQVPAGDVAAAVNEYHGEGWVRLVTEVWHLDFQRRVKFCSRHGSGFGCDNEGEWHSHWHPVKHNDAALSCCYTLALPVWPTRSSLPPERTETDG